MSGSKTHRWIWGLPIAAAAGLLLLIHSARQDTARLHAAHAARLETIAPPAPSQARPAESAPPSDEASAYHRLRDEVQNLRERIAQRELAIRQIAATSAPTESRQDSTRPSALEENFLPPDQWQDRGAVSSSRLIETLLWAGAGGDVQRIANLVTLEDDAMARAEALWDRLPDDLKSSGSDARALVALLATDSVPLDRVKLAGTFQQSAEEHVLILQVAPADVEIDPLKSPDTRAVKLLARRNAAQTWQVVVPAAAIDRFATKLGIETSPPPTPES